MNYEGFGDEISVGGPYLVRSVPGKGDSLVRAEFRRKKEPVLQTFRDKRGSFQIREDSLAGQDIYDHIKKGRKSWGTGMWGVS